MAVRSTRVSVSKRGAVTLTVLVDGVWRGVPLEGQEALWLSDDLRDAYWRSHREGGE